MNELQLVGYTADLRHLVFADAAGTSRYKVPVDEDLVATLTEVLQLAEPGRAATPLADEAAIGRALPDESDNGPARTAPGVGPLAAAAVAKAARARPAAADEAAAVAHGDNGAERPSSRLSPRQLQALLRAGLDVRTVARRAETDEAWVRRWLPPIEAEQRKVRQAVERCRISKPRLGPSGKLVGEALRENLAAKGLDLDGETVEWRVARREEEPYWTVTLRYRSRGRPQRATWHYHPERGELEPRDRLATEIAWVAPASARRRARKATGAKSAKSAKSTKTTKSTSKKAAKSAAAKKKSASKRSTSAKKGAAKKSGAKKRR